jgi:hypothetical protein
LENNREGIHKDTLLSSSAIYHSLFEEKGFEGMVPATFEIIHFTGWKFHES